MRYNEGVLIAKSDHGAACNSPWSATRKDEFPVNPHDTRFAQSTQELQSVEQWREIPGSEGRYEVSDRGRVRSYRYHKQWHNDPLYLTPFVSKIGYVYYRLRIGGIDKNYAAHRLVLLAFVGQSGLEANHKDGDKTHNWLCNLEYITHSENLKHSFDVLGRQPKTGENAPNAKLSDAQIEEIRCLSKQGVRNKDLAQIYGISTVHVSNIKRGKVRGGAP